MNISLDSIIQLVQFIGGIAILIFVHELGHFVTARLMRVEVEEFGFGIPPRMVRLFTAGGTLFSLNWLPLGGFVRFKGDNDPGVPGGFAAANPLSRLIVLFGGPFMNISLGILLAAILYYNIGEPIVDQVRVEGISASSPAEAAGLEVGDLLLEVNRTPVQNIENLQEMIYSNLGKPTELTYHRGGQVNTITLVPRDPPPQDGAIGILMGNPTRPTTWSKAIPSGFSLAYDYTRAVLAMPGRAMRGEVRPEERPLGYKGMYDFYRALKDPLPFFMVISLSLGIFNLLPIPALDGGRILFTLPEILFRRRVPPQFENVIHLVGFAVLIVLLIYINLLDFIDPVQIPR